MCESSGNVERHNDPRHRSHRPFGGAVVSRLASLGHDVVAMVRDVQARTITMIEEKSAKLNAKATEEEKARIERGEA
jgi:hypothetical protein